MSDMTRMLLAVVTCIAAVAGAVPAQAEMAGGFHGTPAGSAFARIETRHGARFASGSEGCFSGSGREGRNHGDRCGESFIGYYGGEWALYNNRSWNSDSYNDWWHDRPDRAYPAWMRHNQDCQRPWFAGNTLTC
jgi:hypothetical protein